MFGIYYNDYDFYSDKQYADLEKAVEHVEAVKRTATIMLENGDKIAYYDPLVGIEYFV